MVQRLGELVNCDLAGWRLVKLYWAELKHGLMGTFPLQVVSTEQPVFCLDKDLLLTIIGLIRQEDYRINEMDSLVNLELGIGFSLNEPSDHDRTKMQALTVLTPGGLELLLKSPAPAFKWAPGLLRLGGR